MKSIKIVPRGVAERSNEASGIRGECLSLMNMRERNESLETVGKWAVMGSAQPSEKVVLIDSRPDADYYFSYCNSGLYLHGKKSSDRYTALNERLCDVNGTVNWLQSVGDFVVASTSAGMIYLYFNGTRYVVMSRDGMVPQIAFQAVNASSITQKVPGADFDIAYSRWSALEETDRLVLQKAVTGAYRSMINRAHGIGGFLQPVAVRYAVRLWDGNCAWVSAPVVVGVGLQMQRPVSALVNNSLSGYDDSSITGMAFNIGATVVKMPSAEWLPLIKSIDVLVSNEVEPYVSGEISCRCETSSGNSYLTYSFPQRERAVAIAELINPESWRVVARVVDMESLYNLKTVLRSDSCSDSLTSKEVYGITRSISNETVSNTGLSLNGRLYTAGHRHMIRNAWSSVQYWGGEIVAQPCEVIVTARLRTKHGMAIKVDSRKYDFTPSRLNAAVSYPDARATELNVKIRCGDAIKEWNGVLGGIDEQGMACFVEPGLSENVMVEGYSFDELTELNTEDLLLTEMAVSSIGNPFVVEQRRMVGQGEVVRLAAASKPIFSGVFGRYPVYAFTSDGIYAVAYRETENYKDSQLISHRVLGKQNAVAVSDDKVFFVSSADEVCVLTGKDVSVLGKNEGVAQMVWVSGFEELLIRNEDNSVEIYMPSGRLYGRDASLSHLLGDYRNAIGQDAAGVLVDLNEERSVLLPVRAETYPIALKEGELAAPLELTAGVYGEADEGSLMKVCGSNGLLCEWQDLSSMDIAGDCCHRLSSRVYARLCRYIKVVLDGYLRTGTLLCDCALKYN